MTVSRHLARPLLAASFLASGYDSLRNPERKAPAAEDVAPAVQSTIPGLEGLDTEQLVRVNGAIQVGAGALLTIGRLPRLSALVLAATLVPTTAAHNRFWEQTGPQRDQQQVGFFKNVSLLGGCLLAALDTEGRPGVVWRTRHATEHAGAAVRRSRREARLAARAAAPRRRRRTKSAA